MIYNGVPQFRRSGLLINNGVPNEAIVDDVELINGVRQLSPNGLEVINGVPQTGAAAEALTAPWVETDPNSEISVDDATLLAATWTLDGNFSGAGCGYKSIVADAGSNYWDGDFVLEYRVRLNTGTTAGLTWGLGLYQQLVAYDDIQASDDYIFCHHLLVGANIIEQINERGDGSTSSDFIAGVAKADEDVWFQLERSGNQYRLRGWYTSDTSGTPDLDSGWTTTGSGNVLPFRYLYLFNTRESGSLYTLDAIVQVISITPNPWA